MTIQLHDIVLNDHYMTQDEVDIAFENYIKATVFPEEGGYSNDPNDSGGETNWGITIAIARQGGYTGNMRDMTQEQALVIYKKNDWYTPGFDKLAMVNLPLAIELLDLGINMGDGTSSKFLQTVLQSLGFYDRKVDGQFGPYSCDGVKNFLAKRGVDGLRVLFFSVRGEAAVRYITIEQNNTSQQEYIYGWLANRAFPAMTA